MFRALTITQGMEAVGFRSIQIGARASFHLLITSFGILGPNQKAGLSIERTMMGTTSQEISDGRRLYSRTITVESGHPFHRG